MEDTLVGGIVATVNNIALALSSILPIVFIAAIIAIILIVVYHVGIGIWNWINKS